MKADWRAALGVVAAMLLINVAWAANVPTLLNELTPSAMPFGLRESGSPTGEAGATFVDVTESAGVTFRRYEWRDGDLPYAAVVGGGLAVGDVDRDGFADLYFTPGGPGRPGALYVNNGDFTFRDAAADAGLALDGFGTGASFGDYDNDGDSDLFVFVDTRGHLFRNDGGIRFTDVSLAAGLTLEGKCGDNPCQASSVAWTDYDLDHDLDLYVVNNLDHRAEGLHTSGQDYASLIYFAPEQLSLLFRNDGSVFTDVTAEAGVENTGKGLGIVATDVDRDGKPDLATANDITPNALYRNLGDGAFRNVARASGANEVKTSMGIVSGDLDGDLRPDLVVSNFRGHQLSLLVQEEPLKFRHLTDERGLGASWRGTGWGVALLDFDLDGWLDVAHAVGRAVPLDPHRNDLNNLVFQELVEDSEDQLFRNLGAGTFAEVTYSAGAFPGNSTTRALAAVDLDNDGDEDVVRVNVQGEPMEVLRNERAGANRWLQLDLRGTTSNRDAIGAVVEATLPDGRVLVRELQSASGYQTGASRVLTIGLGDAGSASVLVRWPGGDAEDFGALAAGERHALVQGDP